MGFPEMFRRAIEPLHNRVMGMVARAVIKKVTSDSGIQELQLSSLGELVDRAEQFQGYGFSSAPFPGAEAVVVYVGGGKDHPLVVASDDKRHRPTDQAEGEVAMYSDEAAWVKLLRDAVVDVQGDEIQITADTKITLTVGASSILIEPAKITITSALIDHVT